MTFYTNVKRQSEDVLINMQNGSTGGRLRYLPGARPSLQPPESFSV